MATLRLDALAAQIQSQMHCDANEANMFARQLLAIRAGVFEQRFPELKAQSFIPKNGTMTQADQQYTYHYQVEYGNVRPTAPSARTQAPRVDVALIEADPIGAKSMTLAYGYDLQEARVAAQTGNQLPARKAAATRRALAFEINDILTYGRAKAGVASLNLAGYGTAFQGIASLSGTLTTTFPTAAAGTDNAWERKGSDEIVADMNVLYSKVITNSKGVEIPDQMILPLSLYELVQHKRMGDGSDVTVLQHFQGTHPGLKIDSWYALDAAQNSEWTGRRTLCYRKAPDVLEYLLPIEFEQLAPVITGWETLTECHARTAGVALYLPKAVNYGDVAAAP